MATKKTTKTSTEEAVVKESKPKTIASPVYKKEFKNDDLIPCKSVTSGELLMPGKRTGRLYRWADCDDIEYVEYQDLLYSTRSRSQYVFEPFFLILDDDFIEQNKELNKVYDGLYSYNELSELLNKPADALKTIVPGLPKGIRDALKGIVATGITNGTFDSVKKIKVFDEIFETDMLRLLLDNE